MSNVPRYPTVDTRPRVVDVLQKAYGLKILLRKVDQAEVEKAVIFGVTVTKAWWE